MKARHYLILAATTLLPLLAAFFSNWDGKITATSIATAFMAAIALWMKSPNDTPVQLPKVPPLAVLALVLGLGSAGCAKVIPVIGPVASCVMTVIADALKGMTLDQIVADAGPTCVTSIDQVIAILVGEAGRNPMVRDTPAYRDARTVAWMRVSP
jgi:hypothetical protein